MGVEALARSTPVITVGEAWLRGKGLSVDVESEDEYHSELSRIPLSVLSPSEHDDALRYANHLFLRRMIPIRAFRAVESRRAGSPLYYADVSSASDLAPGVDPGLDAVCDGIVEGSPFTLDSAGSRDAR